MLLYLVFAGLIGARLVYVLTSYDPYFGPNGRPLDALKVWQGGISIHGGILGIVVATWIFSRIHKLNMWAYLDMMVPAGEPGTATFGELGKRIFTPDLWSAYPGTCSLGSDVSVYYGNCVAQGGEILRGPVHLTQLYGAIVGILLIFIIIWAFRRSRTPGFAFWQFILWYSILRSVIEEPFRDNPIFWNLYLSEGVDKIGMGLLTLTQIASIPIVLIAIYVLATMQPDNKK